MYLSLMVKRRTTSGKIGQTTNFKLKGKKLTLKGTLSKAKSLNAFNKGKYTFLKYKKRTFKLAGGCKYYADGSDHRIRIKKKQLIKLAKAYSNLCLIIFTNNKGKIYKMIIQS